MRLKQRFYKAAKVMLPPLGFVVEASKEPARMAIRVFIYHRRLGKYLHGGYYITGLDLL